MVRATVMSGVITANSGEHTPKENSVTAGQTDVSFRLWARDDKRSARCGLLKTSPPRPTGPSSCRAGETSGPHPL
jgi:hypothetical protein